jgi:hypothetical protein
MPSRWLRVVIRVGADAADRRCSELDIVVLSRRPWRVAHGCALAMSDPMKLGSVVVVGFFVGAAFWPAPRSHPERFTATGLDADNQPVGPMEFVVERRSTDDERQRLLDSVKRPDELREALRSLPRIGYVRGNADFAGDLHYADGVDAGEGGERVILATDPPVRPGEHHALPTTDPFTVIEIRLNRHGDGEGKLSLATGLAADRLTRTMTLADNAMRPILLLSVKREQVDR